jgi:hypothetical protein
MTVKYVNNAGENLYLGDGGGNDNIRFTPEGGLAVRLINNTGSNSVKGEIVRTDTAGASGFIQAPADTDESMGVVYEDNIADDSLCWVVVNGIADVLLKNNTASTVGNWVRISSDTAGRADATSSSTSTANLAKQIGHCIQTKSGGTDVLTRVVLHFC